MSEPKLPATREVPLPDSVAGHESGAVNYSALEWEGDWARTPLGTYKLVKRKVRGDSARLETEWAIFLDEPVRGISVRDMEVGGELVGASDTKREAKSEAQRLYEKAQNDQAEL